MRPDPAGTMVTPITRTLLCPAKPINLQLLDRGSKPGCRAAAGISQWAGLVCTLCCRSFHLFMFHALVTGAFLSMQTERNASKPQHQSLMYKLQLALVFCCLSQHWVATETSESLLHSIMSSYGCLRPEPWWGQTRSLSHVLPAFEQQQNRINVSLSFFFFDFFVN